MFLLLCLIGSVLGGITITDTTKFAALTTNAMINPAVFNFGSFPFNGAFASTDEKYFLYITDTGVTASSQCTPNVGTSCNPQLYSQVIQTVPQTSTNKQLSAGSGSVFSVAESFNGNYLFYQQRPQNLSQSSLVSGYVTLADGSKTAYKVTPDAATDSSFSGNNFVYTADNAFAHMTSATQAVDDRAGLIVSSTNSTPAFVQNDVWIAYFSGDAPYKLSPTLTPYGGTGPKANSWYYGSCFNRIIYESAPTAGTSTLYSSNWEQGAQVSLLTGVAANATSFARQQNVYWSPNGNYYAILYASADVRYTSLHVGSVSSNALLNGGQTIGPAQNVSVNNIPVIRWTADGNNLLFSAVDAAANGALNLYNYNPSTNTRTQVSSFAAPNGLSQFMATNKWVVFSSTGDATQDLADAAVYSWQIGTSTTAFTISPTIVKRSLQRGGIPFAGLHITSDEKRALFLAATKEQEHNLISADITQSGSSFQVNPNIAQGATIQQSAVDAITVVLYGSTEYATFRYRSGFSTLKNEIFQIASSSTLVNSPVTQTTGGVSTDLAVKTTYGASQPYLTPTAFPTVPKVPNGCNIPIITGSLYTSCWGGSNCIIVAGGQAYVYSRVDQTSTDTKGQDANIYQVATVDGTLSPQTLSTGVALPIADVVGAANPWVDQNGQYVVWRVPSNKISDGISTIISYNLFYNKIDGKGTLLQLNGIFASPTQSVVANSLTFTQKTNKAVYFVQQQNFSVYTQTQLFFATLNSDKVVNFDATPTVNTPVDKTNPGQDPLPAPLNGDNNGNVVYYDANAPQNSGTPPIFAATIAISPTGSYDSNGVTSTVYSTVFPQTGVGAPKGYLSKSFKAVAFGNYGTATANPPNFNGFVNSGLSSTLAPLLVLVALFLALF